MHYAAIHVQKFKASATGHIQGHNNREHENYGNKDIDPERFGDNYALLESKNFAADIEERLKNVERTVRKDAVRMVGVIISSDQEFFKKLTPEQEKELFKESLKFLQDKFGKENVFSAVVHKDEKGAPHLHVNLTPVKGARLTAKELFDQKALKALHTDFHRNVGQNWGLERGKDCEGKVKHLAVEEFKVKMAQKQLDQQLDHLAAQELELRRMERDLERGLKPEQAKEVRKMVEAYGYRNKLEAEADKAAAKQNPELAGNKELRALVVNGLMEKWDKYSPEDKKTFEEFVKTTNQEKPQRELDQQKQPGRKRDNDFER